MKIILASNNKNKMREFRELLAGTDAEPISQRDAGCDFEVDETGTTFEENAFLKADAVLKATGCIAVADDSGLVVDALNGEPGIYSARYGFGHDASDADRNRYLLGKLGDEKNRRARFVCCVCCCLPDGGLLPAMVLRAGLFASVFLLFLEFTDTVPAQDRQWLQKSLRLRRGKCG